ncbi:MAG: hypothetical protein J5I53_01625, partial [Bradyrhizobiaceae bacterium]|nr:hypothetical protein [Bradyrhizobiaceae bacterium]
MLSTLLRFALALLLCTLPLTSQVPIDLSQAKEFKVVWKVPLGGSTVEPVYLTDYCGSVGEDMIILASTTRLFSWKTNPVIDTARPEQTWPGLSAFAYDYDGIPPMEYINLAGETWQCTEGDSELGIAPIDTIDGNCWHAPFTNLNAEYSMDIDLDGHLDVVCDVGGGGYAARVVMGGPGAGKGCQRVFHIGRPPSTRHVRTLDAFFPSVRGGGLWHLLQWDKDTNAFYDVLTLWEVTIGRENGILT